MPAVALDAFGLSGWSFTNPQRWGDPKAPDLTPPVAPPDRTELQIIGSAAGILVEPIDWGLTAIEIYNAPSSPWSYAGLVPFVPAGVGKCGKQIPWKKVGDLLDDVVPSAAPIKGGLLPTLQGNTPQADKWIRSGGRVIYHSDGSITYVKNGVSIRYNSIGYPDFSRYLYNGNDGLKQVRIELTGTRPGDLAAANEAAGFASTPKGYTWHHNEDVGLMQLVETRVHGQFWHSGGFSLGK